MCRGGERHFSFSDDDKIDSSNDLMNHRRRGGKEDASNEGREWRRDAIKHEVQCVGGDGVGVMRGS